ncbi:MAG: redoxin domain-containing protein [Flavisolibacter sp.]|nr:redoxin domain-containing protein [Flavisolibacter sp.]
MKFILTILFCWGTLSAFSQIDTARPPYQRYPTLPPMQLLLSDSATLFTKANLSKNKPVLLMLFSPECSHCQHTAEELQQYKEELKNIEIVMATMHSVTQMNQFIQTYRLNELPNVVVGKDIYYILPPFYNIRNLPFMAFYDKKGKLISVFEGSLPMQKVVAVFK